MHTHLCCESIPVESFFYTGFPHWLKLLHSISFISISAFAILMKNFHKRIFHICNMHIWVSDFTAYIFHKYVVHKLMNIKKVFNYRMRGILFFRRMCSVSVYFSKAAYKNQQCIRVPRYLTHRLYNKCLFLFFSFVSDTYFLSMPWDSHDANIVNEWAGS